jgi:hypothetical protein
MKAMLRDCLCLPESAAWKGSHSCAGRKLEIDHSRSVRHQSLWELWQRPGLPVAGDRSLLGFPQFLFSIWGGGLINSTRGFHCENSIDAYSATLHPLYSVSF